MANQRSIAEAGRILQEVGKLANQGGQRATTGLSNVSTGLDGAIKVLLRMEGTAADAVSVLDSLLVLVTVADAELDKLVGHANAAHEGGATLHQARKRLGEGDPDLAKQFDGRLDQAANGVETVADEVGTTVGVLRQLVAELGPMTTGVMAKIEALRVSRKSASDKAAGFQEGISRAAGNVVQVTGELGGALQKKGAMVEQIAKG
jgi:hypothetical protein